MQCENGRPYLYFVHADGFVKIGWTLSPRSRFLQIKAHNPHPVTMLALIPGGQREELEWHVRFERDHVRGEWFKLSTSLRSAILDLRPRSIPFVEAVRKSPTKSHRQQQRRDRLVGAGTPPRDMNSHESPTTDADRVDAILMKSET